MHVFNLKRNDNNRSNYYYCMCFMYMHVLYTCVASTSRIITQPTNTSAAAPFSGVFTCSVIGYGYQMITWRKQPGTLPHKHNTRQVTSQGITTSTLIIPNVTEEDVGEYKCQVWANNMQVDSEKVNLHYSGKADYLSVINTYIQVKILLHAYKICDWI